jgi:hypothetical protein
MIMRDEDGYPTVEALQAIREFKPSKREDWHDLMAFVRRLWVYADYFEDMQQDDAGRLVHEYRVSTAGWSGHEDVIDALQDNALFWLDCWYSSRRGGHHVFRLVPKGESHEPAGC